MKRIMIIFVFIILVHAPVFGQSKNKESEVGRFSLFQGRYKITNVKGEAQWVEELFKIDTMTGKIYICSGSQTEERFQIIIQSTECKPFEQTIHIRKNP